MKNVRKTLIQCGVALACLTALGCESPSPTEFKDADTKISPQPKKSPSPSADISDEVLRPPLNCRLMIITQHPFSARENTQYLTFSFQENPEFDPLGEDDCEGDLKNLWPDLTRFDAEIEAYMPNIRGISGTERVLKIFPQTERALKLFIDDAATEAKLHDTIGALDRTTLEGGMQINRTILTLITENQKAYFAQEHTPIIESVLSKYDLKMRPYATEKLKYCYHPRKKCRGPGYSRNALKNAELKLERLGAGISWYQFELPD